MAQGSPYSAAGLTIRSERLFIVLSKDSALLTEETAFAGITRADTALGDHLIIHASCN